MSFRAVGVLLILAASASAAAGAMTEQRHRLHMAEALANALDRLAAGIRFRRLPLPEALRDAETMPECGSYFLKTRKYMESNIALHDAWHQTFSEIEDPTAQEILLRLMLDGDEERLLGNLTLARDQLRAYAVEVRQQSAARSRLLWTGALSAGGLLTILLL